MGQKYGKTKKGDFYSFALGFLGEQTSLIGANPYRTFKLSRFVDSFILKRKEHHGITSDERTTGTNTLRALVAIGLVKKVNAQTYIQIAPSSKKMAQKFNEEYANIKDPNRKVNKMKKEMNELKALGTGNTQYSYDNPVPDVLEKFPAPFDSDISGTVEIVCPEFTSLCPKTGQPDFATIKIYYEPDKWCVESKSLKLYLMGFRNHGEFHESCVNRICKDLANLLQPAYIRVVGEFTPRGGIPFWPTAVWSKE